MFKVVLLMLLFDPKSGQIHGAIHPMPGYETRAECEAAVKEFVSQNPAPPGLAQRGYCIVPNEVSI